MHDEHDEIIYVGKAISLKNRVRQYFQSSRNKTAKIEKMVSRIARFEYIITDSELEALVLECNLIKEHRPRYNTMLKDDNHRTRGLYYNNVEIPIDRHSEGFKLVTRIQDEAHRFAIEYHRSLRSKAQVHSVLDDIEGIGPARRKALMRRFKSLEAVRDATLEELESTEGMNKRAAESVYAYFREKDRAPEITE